MNQIMANDTVKHIPTGETWTVCGVCHESDELVPCGYPPCIAKISDCEKIKDGYSTKQQTQEQRDYLTKHFSNRFYDVASAMFDGII